MEFTNLKQTNMKVGITGEMGSGKTYVSDFFAKLGVPIYNCDMNAKLLVVTNDKLKADIQKYFGENIYDGNVFKNLSAIVFAKDEQSVKNLEILTGLIYPYLYEDIEVFHKKHEKAIYVLIESAVLYEYDMDKKMDAVIYVSVELDVRKKRAMNRDKISSEDYDNRMKTQIDPNIKKAKATHLVYNDGKSNVKARVDVIHSTIQNNWIFEHNDVY